MPAVARAPDRSQQIAQRAVAEEVERLVRDLETRSADAFALALALDDLPATSGQVTTAVAMGDALLARLQKSGMRFEVLEAS